MLKWNCFLSIYYWKQDMEIPYNYCIAVIFSLQICLYLFNILDSPLLDVCIFTIVAIFFASCYNFWLNVYFIWCKCSCTCSLLVSDCVKYPLLSLHIKPMCVLEAKMSYFKQAHSWFFVCFFHFVLFLIHSVTLCLLFG